MSWETADNSDLTIVRGLAENTVEITGYRDQVRVNQAVLLQDFREFDTTAAYSEMT